MCSTITEAMKTVATISAVRGSLREPRRAGGGRGRGGRGSAHRVSRPQRRPRAGRRTSTRGRAAHDKSAAAFASEARRSPGARREDGAGGGQQSGPGSQSKQALALALHVRHAHANHVALLVLSAGVGVIASRAPASLAPPARRAGEGGQRGGGGGAARGAEQPAEGKLGLHRARQGSGPSRWARARPGRAIRPAQRGAGRGQGRRVRSARRLKRGGSEKQGSLLALLKALGRLRGGGGAGSGRSAAHSGRGPSAKGGHGEARWGAARARGRQAKGAASRGRLQAKLVVPARGMPPRSGRAGRRAVPTHQHGWAHHLLRTGRASAGVRVGAAGLVARDGCCHGCCGLFIAPELCRRGSRRPAAAPCRRRGGRRNAAVAATIRAPGASGGAGRPPSS